MQFTLEHVYAKGVGAVNEDAFVIDEAARRFAVIDGATGLGKWSGELAAAILKEALGQTDKSLMDCVRWANGRLQQELRAAGVDLRELDKSERSTCGFVALEWKGNRLEYVHAGDCMLFLRYADGRIRQVTYDHLAKLDAMSIAEMHGKILQLMTGGRMSGQQIDEESEPGAGPFPLAPEEAVKQARHHIQPMLVANRRLLNTAEGYGVFDGSEEALAFMDFGSIALQNVKQMLLVSDGLQLPGRKGAGAWAPAAGLPERGADARAHEAGLPERGVDTAAVIGTEAPAAGGADKAAAVGVNTEAPAAVGANTEAPAERGADAEVPAAGRPVQDAGAASPDMPDRHMITCSDDNLWLETAQYAFAHGLQALYEKVVQMENEDPYLVMYPRLKFADDKTGILIRMNGDA